MWALKQKNSLSRNGCRCTAAEAKSWTAVCGGAVVVLMGPRRAVPLSVFMGESYVMSPACLRILAAGPWSGRTACATS
uniref:Uncharacterized protein n=1 Tax=Ascaris lumbricoides TaxID=6252 RepID=A0A0M3I272_ASCLU